MKYEWQIQNQELVYDGYFKMFKFRLDHALFSGGSLFNLERELLERGKAAAVLPYDPAINQILLVEQFRIGAIKEATPWQIELIAGIIEPGEKPVEVVCREAKEEAGITVKNPKKICSYLSSPGASTEKLYVYYAETDLKSAGGIHGLTEEGEDIRVCLYKPEELFAKLDEDKINNAMTLIALQWFRRYYEQKNCNRSES